MLRKFAYSVVMVSLVGICLALRSASQSVLADAPSVVINEIMYNPASDDDNDEFLELYNTTDNPIDLTDWCFTEGISVCFSGVTIQPDDFLVISPDLTQTQNTYGVTPDANYTGKLSNGGETLTLVDDESIEINSISYLDESPWPSSPDGDGPSLELKDPLLDNTLSASWGASVSSSTPDADNSLLSYDPPVISDTDQPTDVSAEETPIVTANVQNASVVELTYKVGFDDDVTLTMHDDGSHGDGSADDNVYGATIPAQTEGSLVRFKVTAENAEANSSVPSNDESINYYGYVVTDPSIDDVPPVLQWFIEDENYSALQEEDPNNKVYYPTVVAYGDQVFDNAEVRLKGHYSATFPKKPYKFKLPAGHQLSIPGLLDDPLNEFHVNSDFPNNKYITSLISWDVAEYAGMPVPQVGKIRLQRNGNFDGAYTLAEKYDVEWRERNPFYETGSIYDGFNEKEQPDDADYTDIEDWRDNMRNLTGEAKRNYVLDNNNIPSLINFMAFQAVIRHHDWGFLQNVMFHRDTEGSGRWDVLPWDLDLAFQSVATTPDEYTQGYGDMIDPNDIIPSLADLGEDRFFVAPIWEDTELKAMYLRRVRTLIDSLYSDGLLEDFIDQRYQTSETVAELDYDVWYDWEDDNNYAFIRDIISGLGHDPNDPVVIEGYEVARLTNGKTGLEWALENHPDIILLDLQMPVMDGKEMLGKLREDKWGAKAPVIILTNLNDNTSIYEVVGIGTSSSLNDYCVKADTSLEEIINLIQQKLNSKA